MTSQVLVWYHGLRFQASLRTLNYVVPWLQADRSDPTDLYDYVADYQQYSYTKPDLRKSSQNT